MMRFLLPVLILLALLGAAWLILSNPPGAARSGPPDGPRTVVEVVDVRTQSYRIDVASYGTVQPRTQSMLVAQ